MSGSLKESPSILTLTMCFAGDAVGGGTDTNPKNVFINNPIPQQVLTLSHYTVTYYHSTTFLPNIYVKIGSLTNSQILNDDNPSQTLLSLKTAYGTSTGGVVEMSQFCDLDLYMNQVLPKNFQMACYDENGALLTLGNTSGNLVRVTLQFNYNYTV